MKIISFITLLLCISCSSKKNEKGLWNINLKLKSESIDFAFKIYSNKAILYNGQESITLKRINKNGKMIFPIANYNAGLEISYKDNGLSGHWIKYDKDPEYKVVLSGKRMNQKPKKISLPPSFNKKWRIDFYKKDKIDSSAILLFSKNDQGSFASILTTTGDYRFLKPRVENRQLTLSGFDGIFAFKITGKISADKITGIMHAGKSFSQKFIAYKDQNFELTDPSKITKITPKSLNICLPSLKGDKICLNTFSKKVKVIQLFGSWCPNCIDETKFIMDYKKRNPHKNVEYFIISFERSVTKKAAIKSLKKTKKMYRIDYPILIGGYTSDTKVSSVIRGIDNFNAFPTLIVIDHKGKIQKVHSGFNGPATGIYYTKFKKEFSSLIKELQRF